jgi:hypothetical protein
MPVSRYILLLALCGVSLAVVGGAWASDGELFWYFGGRRLAWNDEPPTHPGAIVVWIVVSSIFFALRSDWGWIVGLVNAVGLVGGTILGPVLFNWTASGWQYAVTSMWIAATWYGWSQREYFSEAWAWPETIGG